jgi:hypothetical protein
MAAVMAPRALTLTPTIDNSWWVGVLLEGFGAGLSASGKLMWRYAAMSRDPVKWYAMGSLLSMVFYPVLDTTAYIFTSQQILSASSGYIISFNVLGATILLHETLTVSRACGVLVIVMGSAASVAFGNHLQYNYSAADYWNLLLQPSAIVYYAGLGGWLSFSAWALLTRRGSQVLDVSLRPVLMAALGGSCSGNMWVTKVAMELLECTTRATGCALSVLMSTAGLLLVTVSIHLVSLALLAYALRTGSALQLVTTYEAFSLLTSALSSALVLSEYTGMSANRLFIFYATGVLPIMVGLLLLAAWPTRIFGDGERVCLDMSNSGIDMACIEARLDGTGADAERCCPALMGCLRRARRLVGGWSFWQRFAAAVAEHGGGGGGGGTGGGLGGGSGVERLPSESTKLLYGAAPEQPTYRIQRSTTSHSALSWAEGISGGAPSAAPAAPPNLDATGTTYSTTV